MQLERIEKYLKQQMDANERQTFEQEMASDVSLAEEVASFQDVQQIVEVAGDAAFFNKLQSIEDELTGNKSTTTIRPFWQRPMMLGIAAAVIIILAGIWIFQPAADAPADLFAENFQAYPPPARLRGATSQDQIWSNARDAYVQADYAQAAQQFEFLLAQDSTAQPAYLLHFYAGISQLAQPSLEAEKAISHLEIVARTDSDYVQPAQWYLALAYLQNKELQKAKALLEELAKGNYRKEAVDLLIKGLK
jgi:hypothetical protein